MELLVWLLISISIIAILAYTTGYVAGRDDGLLVGQIDGWRNGCNIGLKIASESLTEERMRNGCA